MWASRNGHEECLQLLIAACGGQDRPSRRARCVTLHTVANKREWAWRVRANEDRIREVNAKLDSSGERGAREQRQECDRERLLPMLILF